MRGEGRIKLLKPPKIVAWNPYGLLSKVWTLEEEMEPFTYMRMTQGGLLYSKGSDGAAMVAVSGMSAIDPSMPAGTFYVIATGPFSVLEGEF